LPTIACFIAHNAVLFEVDRDVPGYLVEIPRDHKFQRPSVGSGSESEASACFDIPGLAVVVK
jgi:hypothetical protein